MVAHVDEQLGTVTGDGLDELAFVVAVIAERCLAAFAKGEQRTGLGREQRRNAIREVAVLASDEDINGGWLGGPSERLAEGDDEHEQEDSNGHLVGSLIWSGALLPTQWDLRSHHAPRDEPNGHWSSNPHSARHAERDGYVKRPAIGWPW